MRTLIVIPLLVFTLRAGGQTPAGQTPAGQTPAGQTPAGQTPAGQTPAGQTPAGQTSPTPAPSIFADTAKGVPVVVMARVMADGLFLDLTICKCVPELQQTTSLVPLKKTASYDEVVDGKTVRKTKTVTEFVPQTKATVAIRTVRELSLRKVAKSAVTIRRGDGGDIPWATAATALADWTPILVSPLREAVSAEHMALFQPNVIVAFVEKFDLPENDQTVRKNLKSGPPEFIFASLHSNDRVRLRSKTSTTTPFTVTGDAEKGRAQTFQGEQTIDTSTNRLFPRSAVKVFRGDGEQPTPMELHTRLGAEHLCLYSPSGQRIDPAWFTIVRAKTLVVWDPAPQHAVAAGSPFSPSINGPASNPKPAIVPKSSPLPAVPAIAAKPAPAATPKPLEATLDGEMRELLALTNAERKKAGLAPLAFNATLAKTAQEHSANMARQMRIGHVLDGKGPADRVRAAGYGFRAMAENCAEGQRNPAEAVQDWMMSPGHRANLLNDVYTEIGLGVAEGGGRRYWTQVFGRPLN